MKYWIKLCLVAAIIVVGGVILSCVANDAVLCGCCYVMLFMLLADDLKN